MHARNVVLIIDSYNQVILSGGMMDFLPKYMPIVACQVVITHIRS